MTVQVATKRILQVTLRRETNGICFGICIRVSSPRGAAMPAAAARASKNAFTRDNRTKERERKEEERNFSLYASWQDG